MKKRIIALLLSALFLFSLVSCNVADNTTTTASETTEIVTTQTTETTEDVTPIEVKDEYEVKAVNVYREAGVVDKTLDIRFYSEAPHGRFISVT